MGGGRSERREAKHLPCTAGVLRNPLEPGRSLGMIGLDWKQIFGHVAEVELVLLRLRILLTGAGVLYSCIALIVKGAEAMLASHGRYGNHGLPFRLVPIHALILGIRVSLYFVCGHNGFNEFWYIAEIQLLKLLLFCHRFLALGLRHCIGLALGLRHCIGLALGLRHCIGRRLVLNFFRGFSVPPAGLEN